jgi:hypothetical protein
MCREADPERVLLPVPDLITILTDLAACDQPMDLKDRSFWTASHWLAWQIQDGMEALMTLAKDSEIGWYMNAGYRCDVDFDQYRIEAVCQKARFCRGSDEPIHVEVQALTAQGALAGGLLAIFQERLRREAAMSATQTTA